MSQPFITDGLALLLENGDGIIITDDSPDPNNIGFPWYSLFTAEYMSVQIRIQPVNGGFTITLQLQSNQQGGSQHDAEA